MNTPIHDALCPHGKNWRGPVNLVYACFYDVYVNFSQLFLKFCQDYTYRSTSTELPTERNKFDWVKLSLDISLRFSLLSLTRHNDDILGRKHPLRWGGHLKSIYTPPKLVATPLIIWHPPFPKCWIKPCVMCVVVVGAVLRVFHMLCVTCDCVYSQHCLHSFYHANIELVSHILCSSVAANLL